MDATSAALLVTVLVLAFCVGSLTSLVKVLAHKVMDLGENKQLEGVISRRKASVDLPPVFRDDDADLDIPQLPPEPRRTRAPVREPRDLWQRVPNDPGEG